MEPKPTIAIYVSFATPEKFNICPGCGCRIGEPVRHLQTLGHTAGRKIGTR
jgi:hypothetical protein